jgi:ATP-binding cassette subfamily B multidrug efflux pump
MSMHRLRRLLIFVKPYWRRSLVALFLLTSLVVMDLAIPRLIQHLIDQGISQGNSSVVLRTSLLMLSISAISTLFAIGNNTFSVQVGEGVARDLRDALFVKIQSFSFGNIDRFTTGKLMVRLTSDTSAVQRLVQISLRIGTRAPLMMLGSLILMFNTDRRLALTVLPLLLVTSVVIALFSVKMEPLYRMMQQKLDRLNTVLQENIAGVRLVKAFVRADHEEARFAVSNQEFTERSMRVTQYVSIMGPLLSIFVNIGMVTVIWAGGLEVIGGEMSVGQIVAFTNYLLTTMGPLIMMTMLSNVWAGGFASLQRVGEVLDDRPDVEQAADSQPLPSPARGQVVFEDVAFHYDGANSGTVLAGINLVAEPGEMVAILGATGAGKSSLVHLIPRFYDANAGRVLIDGVDVRQLQQDALLSQIGIVPQETILFSGSVHDNICYGRPQASDEEVIAAAQAAQAHDFILQLPQGYDTHVEERGVNLSGGQKQRIAIARALLTQPTILILDDSTSAVDVETESKIQAGMNELMAGCTSFVVAQRISTVLNADKILVIDQGRIAAQGRHATLLHSSPIYREIYDSQLGSGLRDAQATLNEGRSV